MASRNNDINIPIFDGADYNNWKIRLLKFLQFKKCKDVVLRLKQDTDDEKWVERDIQATNYIYSAITNKQLEYISELDTAYEIIQKFDEMYLKKSTALQIVCRHNLESVKLKNYTKNSKHIEVHYHFIHENVKQGNIVVVKIESENNVADILTKALGNVKYVKFREMLNVKE